MASSRVSHANRFINCVRRIDGAVRARAARRGAKRLRIGWDSRSAAVSDEDITHSVRGERRGAAMADE